MPVVANLRSRTSRVQVLRAPSERISFIAANVSRLQNFGRHWRRQVETQAQNKGIESAIGKRAEANGEGPEREGKAAKEGGEGQQEEIDEITHIILHIAIK